MNRFHDSVDLPNRLVNEYRHIFFARNFFQDPDLLMDEMRAVEASLIDEIPVLENGVQEIECYTPQEMPSERIVEELKQEMRPMVIRGYAGEFECVKKWTPEYFRDNYGDFEVFFTSTESILNDANVRLQDFVNGVLGGSKGREYIENLSDIFNAFPELHDDIGIEQLAGLLDGYATYHKIAQFFLGGLGTGAVFHCANELNLFLNIYGNKRWTFVHPKYAVAMDTSIFNKGFFVGSFVKHNAPSGFIEAKFPLYNRVPRLRVTLEPGDLLINPPWWWHAIDNITPATIAVATRWEFVDETQRQNPLFDFIQSFRTERLSLKGKVLESDNLVVPDEQIRKNYLSYEAMGWKAK